MENHFSCKCLFGLEFQVTVHNYGKSGQELKSIQLTVKNRDRVTARMLACLLSGGSTLSYTIQDLLPGEYCHPH